MVAVAARPQMPGYANLRTGPVYGVNLSPSLSMWTIGTISVGLIVLLLRHSVIDSAITRDKAIFLASIRPDSFLRGEEWRGWFRRRPPALALEAVVGKLSLELREHSRALVRFTPQEPVAPDRLTVHLVILGFGLATDVGGGENRGRRLEGDFVVLGYRSAKQSSSLAEWDVALPNVVPASTKRRAIAAWVSVDGDLTPRQAVGGWLPSDNQGHVPG